MEKVAVIGAGSWGTALSMVLADNGHGVRIYGNSPEISQKLHVEMPITNAIYEVLFHGKNAKEAVDSLMNRMGRDEISIQLY